MNEELKFNNHLEADAQDWDTRNIEELREGIIQILKDAGPRDYVADSILDYLGQQGVGRMVEKTEYLSVSSECGERGVYPAIKVSKVFQPLKGGQ